MTRSTPPSLETSCQNTTSRKSNHLVFLIRSDRTLIPPSGTSMRSSNVSKVSKKEEKVEAEKMKRRGEE